MSSDQDVFIAALILNPAHKTQPFAKSSWFSDALVVVLMCRLWVRLFKEVLPGELVREIPDYLADQGFYAQMQVFRNLQVRSALDEVR